MKTAEEIYEAIRQRFDSKLTCGPDKDEPWWDWLAVYLKAVVEPASARERLTLEELARRLADAALDSLSGDRSPLSRAYIRTLLVPKFLHILRDHAAARAALEPEADR